MILPADSCVLNVLGDENPLWHHSLLDHFDSEVKQCTHISSQVTMHSRYVSLRFKQVPMFGRQQHAMPSSQTLTTFRPTSHALSRTISVQQLCYCWMPYHALKFACFPKSALWCSRCSHYLQLLAEHEHVVGSRLLSAFRKLTVPITDISTFQDPFPISCI
jgi:hypothetical protein